MDVDFHVSEGDAQAIMVKVGSKRHRNMDTTIDLTIDESPPRVQRPSTSTAPELIDLSIENDNPKNGFRSDIDSAMLCDDLPPPPKIPLLDQPRPEISCPICYANMLQVPHVMTTKCGHLFCQSCILDCLKARGVCPICRRKVLKSQVHIVYLNQALN